MGFFTKRERAELNKVTEVEGEIRDFVRERRDAMDDGQHVASRLTFLIDQVAGSSIQEIDHLTARLQALRAQLHAQGERVQREVVEYAALSQSTMQSTRIIAENLARWKMTHVAAAGAEPDELAPPTVPAQDGADD